MGSRNNMQQSPQRDWTGSSGQGYKEQFSLGEQMQLQSTLGIEKSTKPIMRKTKVKGSVTKPAQLQVYLRPEYSGFT
jgi:hypothetical protein